MGCMTKLALLCRTPLIAAVASNIVNLGLDCFLIFVLGWGVAGAALATSASQYASFAVMYYLMLKKGMLRQQDMATVPGLAQVLPILQVSTPHYSMSSHHCLHPEFTLWLTAPEAAGKLRLPWTNLLLGWQRLNA